MKKRLLCPGVVFVFLWLLPGNPAGAEEKAPLFSLTVAPAMSVPLGTSLDLFRFVGGAGVGGELRMPFFDPLSIEGRLGYTFFQIRNAAVAEQSLSLLSLGVDLGMQFDLLPLLSLKVFAGGGYEDGFSNAANMPANGGGAFLEGGAQLSWFFLPDFGVRFSLAYRNELGLFQGLVASIGAGIRFGGTQGDILQMGNVQFGDIFPVFHKYYDDHDIGTAELTNTGRYPATDIAVSLEIKPYMTAPKTCSVQQRLEPGASASVDMYALFSEEQILAVTEGTKASATITWRYKENGVEKTGTRVETVRILNRNSITWKDDRMIAAFITALDPAVLTFAKNVAGVSRAATNLAMDRKVLTAVALYEAICQYGMKYVVDPQSSYASLSGDTSAVDFVQFPQQTLTYRGGDCDDLTALYCALFESIGIPTAFITIPAHIYMAFSLGMTPEEAQRSFQHPEDIISVGDTAWFPIEVTSLDGKFLEAWELGAKEWRDASAAGQANLYPTSEAWKTYEPVGLIGGAFTVTVPPEAQVAAAFNRELQRVVDREIFPLISSLESEIQSDPNNTTAMNRLGVLYAKYNEFDKAEKEFLAVIARNESAPALMNLGNISYLRKDLRKAAQYYERAYNKIPNDPKVVANLARTYWESEDFARADAYYQKLQGLDPQLALQMSYVGGQGTGATARASDVSGTRGEVLWGDE